MKLTRFQMTPVTILTAILMASGLAACSPSDAGAGESSSSETVAAQDGDIKFQQCMADEGIEVSINDSSVDISSDESTSQDQIDAAVDKCSKFREDSAVSGDKGVRKSDAEIKEGFLKVAQCMRDKGHDYPDPEFDSTGDGLMVSGEPKLDEAGIQDHESCMQDAGLQ